MKQLINNSNNNNNNKQLKIIFFFLQLFCIYCFELNNDSEFLKSKNRNKDYNFSAYKLVNFNIKLTTTTTRRTTTTKTK